MKSTLKLMLRIAAVVVLVLAIAPMILAQQDSTAPGQEDRRSNSARIERERADLERRERLEHELQDRLFALRELEIETRKPVERRDPRVTLMLIREDLMRIQRVNKELVQAVASATSVDPKFVAKSASEIKRRAERLKLNLVLPDPPGKDTKSPTVALKAEPEQLKPSVTVLSKLITGFVNNPIFKNANTVNAQLSAKAQRDLEGIVELSNSIQKSSERLNKAAQKPQ